VTVTTDAAMARADVALAAPAQAPALRRLLSARDGARLRVVTSLEGQYPVEALVVEQTLTVNTAAAGGNASLMTLAPA
jgi:RHH-type proline utilization regulon transcriptional repressor/proline dehydrogenase/delta 1-pyrroline-5-carboxylate dehydrogenase